MNHLPPSIMSGEEGNYPGRDELFGLHCRKEFKPIYQETCRREAKFVNLFHSLQVWT